MNLDGLASSTEWPPKIAAPGEGDVVRRLRALWVAVGARGSSAGSEPVVVTLSLRNYDQFWRDIQIQKEERLIAGREPQLRFFGAELRCVAEQPDDEAICEMRDGIFRSMPF